MDAEAEIRFVVAHPERRGGDDGLHEVAAELILDLDPSIGVHLSGVGRDVVTAVLEEAGEPFGLGDGEDVDDAGTGDRVECVGDPCGAGQW